MPKFSKASQARLDEAHPLLKKLFVEVGKTENITILDGKRGRKAQEAAFARGNSRARFGQSPHNYVPCIALDVVPYPIDWNNIARFKALAKVVKAKAAAMKIPVVHGGDWKTLRDYPHWELTPWRTYAAKAKLYQD